MGVVSVTVSVPMAILLVEQNPPTWLVHPVDGIILEF